MRSKTMALIVRPAATAASQNGRARGHQHKRNDGSDEMPSHKIDRLRQHRTGCRKQQHAGGPEGRDGHNPPVRKLISRGSKGKRRTCPRQHGGAHMHGRLVAVEEALHALIFTASSASSSMKRFTDPAWHFLDLATLHGAQVERAILHADEAVHHDSRNVQTGGGFRGSCLRVSVTRYQVLVRPRVIRLFRHINTTIMDALNRHAPAQGLRSGGRSGGH